jgi:hypothetical protein
MLHLEEYIPLAGTTMTITDLNPQWVEELKASYHNDKWAQELLSQQVKREAIPGQYTIHNDIIR